MPLRIINLGSGSRGNATIICHGRETLLVDCGFSRRQILKRMTGLGLDPRSVNGIFITHEHGDHIKGAAVCSQELGAPIFATAGTIRGGGLSSPPAQAIQYGVVTQVGKFTITALPISHDTLEPCAFLVEVAGVRSLFATDLGIVNSLDISGLTDLDYLFVEANHDEQMLALGPYPAFLKTRIMGAGGHLDNVQSGALIKSLAAQSPGLKAVMLAHLSDKNNDPELALNAVHESAGSLDGVRWFVARQDEPTVLA